MEFSVLTHSKTALCGFCRWWPAATRQIGERISLAEKTVKNYVSSLFAKLGMERRTQAAAYATPGL